MSTKVPQNNADQEIDLTFISKKISGLMQRINASVFRGIQFFVRNWIVVLILVVAGFALGIFLDSKQKKYEHKIIVSANFGSTDYLSSKIDLINSKINEEDTVFIKENVGIQQPKNLKTIEIKPIADVYNFIRNKPENFELIKLMAEDGDIKKILDDNMTSKNYSNQEILIITSEKTSEEKLIQPLLKYFNSSDYYSKVQKETYNNVVTKMKQNDSIIKQIDAVLSNFSNTSKGSLKNDKLVYYNENTQLNDIIKTKDALLNEQSFHRLELIGFDKTIKDNSISINIENQKPLFLKLKFLLPIIFLMLFILWTFGKRFYQRQSALN